MAQENWDRTKFAPQHNGRNVLPCMPLFTRLLRLAHRKLLKVAVRDVRANTERTYLELLTDVLDFRERMKDIISSQNLEAIRKGQEIYIAVLAPGGYEFAVGVLAVLATGEAVVPMTTVLPVEEASYFVNKSQAVAVLAAESALNLGMGLQRHINLSTNKDFKCIPLKPSIVSEPLSSADIYISSDRYMDDNAPGVVIFTSGTTGPPKGAVMRRAFTHDFALQVVEHYGIGQDDTVLHCLPVHHATGIGIMFFPLLMAGATTEFRSGGFDEV
ncbi:hypothetical protein EG328_000397 [Venturia inaequalis]|uniref:AMP-dependent synthetase/ligase domain-containing protein n=1 Tax=Venturia inaequalis TaxID=5025 RepID=A0A8H3VTI1_VENIN|nr:hypothetical protein EG328_000397 [Venturia inaequalis]KAE9993786.1 hypothetical protein EG327_003291 [Venturia inaequalis]RDI81342.1 hypothetical protein Vi05172_g8651 [Venturia inaequalis]